MPRKYDLITELYKHSLETLTESPQKWEAFLRTAANNYKYSFRDQVLIFAQRPDATACAEFDAWHSMFDRRINRGATGIALIADKQGYTGLRHVFDVSDTYHREGKPLDVWAYKPEYESEVVLALENSFGDLEKTKPIAEAVLSTADNAVEDNATDYLQDLLYSKDNSFLEELDELNIEKELKELLKASVAYASLVRLGIAPEPYFEHSDFDFLKDFNTPSVINILGCATSDITEMCLRIAERTVRSLEKNEKKEIRTFDDRKKEPYNNGEKQPQENGGHENGSNNDLHREERSAVSESRSTGTEGTDARQIRDDTQGVSDEASQGNLHDASDRSEADGASVRDRADSESADFGEYIPTGDEPWGNGEDESREPDAVGSDDEQHQELGGGRSSEQSHLRVSTSLPGCMPEILIAALRHDEYLKAKKGEIVSFLRSETDEQKKNEYVKNLYEKKCFTEFFKDGTEEHIGYYASDEGLLIYDGAYFSHTAETSFSWDLTRNLIEALIRDGNYLDKPKAGEQITLEDMPLDPPKETAMPTTLQNKRLLVSQEVIDSFLRLGGCTKNSNYHIYGYYRRANNPEENVEYLRAVYETDAVGIIVNGQKAAVSWDDSGVTFAQGERVYNAWNTYKMSWAEIDKRIRELMELGQYIGQSEVENAITAYDNSVGARIAYIMRDFFRDKDIAFKPEGYLSWEDEFRYYAKVLNDPDKVKQFAEAFTKATEEMTEKPRRRPEYMPKFTAMLIRSYLRDPVDFPAQENILPPEHFYAQDQIDNSLIRSGSSVSNGKFRIYSFFLMHRDTQERARFLSNEYGIGGSSGMRGGDTHDSKGLALIGGLDRIGDKGVLLNWTQVAKRIDELIRKDRYLNEQEVAHLDTYEKEQVARAINGFYQDKGDDVPRPFERHENDIFEDRSAEIMLQLDDRERLDEILSMMQEVFDSEMPGNRHYDYDKRALETVNKYADGTFNLFPGAVSRRKAVTPTVREETPEPEEEQPFDVDLSDTGYDLKLGTTVHIGQDEFDILSISREKVELFDGTLIPLEMPFDVFIRRIGENPLNDHLKVPETAKAVSELTVKQVGDFYEFYGDDAKIASEILGLTLTSRSVNGERVPMCGYPRHKQDEYLKKLADADYKVNIAESTVNRERRFYAVESEELLSDPYEVWDSVKNQCYVDENGNKSTFVSRWQADDFASEMNRWVEEHPEYDKPTEAQNQEIDLLYKILFYHKVDDIDIYFNENGEICGKDEDNTWVGLDFYKFLGDELMYLGDDEPSAVMTEELTNEFLNYAARYGYKVAKKQKYDLGYGYLGNGLTVYNKAVEVNGDYPTVAHIDDDGEIKYYDDNFPADLIAVIEKAAEAEKAKHAEIPVMQEVKPKVQVPVFNDHPEIPDEKKRNYRIEDDRIGVGTPSERFYFNRIAIETLKKLEGMNALAKPEEQVLLSRYVGWGGLADCFDEKSSHYQELRQMLDDDEYNAARESTLTAFFTPPTVIRAMYKALENMGFRCGNILEPSCGVGNFIGMKPDTMNEAKVYGVELDGLTGRIAKQLYQKSSITVSGFEETQFPDSFFDVAIGNVPFGQFKVSDRKYDKHNFLIHDYFFAKALDKVRPGGVIAFITSHGTLDKENPAVRKYIAQRADLLGAIRLPNDAFKYAAGTEVTSDIIFLQKRDRLIDMEPDWIHLGTDANGITMNQYFIDHPDMIMGEMTMQSGQFGPEATCRPYENEDLSEMLNDAISNLHADIPEATAEELDGEVADSIPADPSVRNYSFALIGGKVYYRQNSVMNPVDTSVTGENRIKGMIALRDIVRKLIDYQMENYPDEAIEKVQAQLNREYDAFTRKYGIINSRANAAVFSDDNSYYLLCSLEVINDKGEMERKADMFTKRTINPRVVVDRVDTASEALAVSLSERAKVDIDYMCELTGMEREKIIADLEGVIFRDVNCPTNQADLLRAPIDLDKYRFVTADEYLSGNVREKLRMICALEQVLPAEEFAKISMNKISLEAVQPQDLSAADIGVRLGSTWVPQEDVQQFVYELLGTPYYLKGRIEVKFIPATAQWLITGKTYDRGNIKSRSVYGTARINGYNIIEETLNLKDVRIFDYVEDENGNKKPVLNKKETTIAQGKQEQIKRAFEEWIWKDPERRERLTRLYNDTFNSTRPREFCGDFVHYYGMNPEISLRQHQKNAVARIIYGGNTLLAHVVGAGKTFTMVAAAQESKRLGLCSKSMFVVPNHLIGQWASEYLQLYPSANILVANKKDFETKNRKKFCARIATGDYDAIIIGHSQFEKIPVSLERQRAFLQAEIDELLAGIQDLKHNSSERLTVKQLEKARKGLQAKLDKLNDQSRKDNVIDFEQLGIDRIFVDEAHMFKNLFVYTKMRNVAGISQTEAQKSSDLYMKCRYLDENTEGKGVIFATGTPISNSMTELYTMQRYLQYTDLKMRGLASFDAWASTFGETVTAIELSPEGTGYRAKTRFSKFFNIPELMAMFKEVADVQTADMLDLPVPEAHYRIVKVEASDIQKEMVQSFAERAEKVRAGMVSSSVDNMLVITNDGRKAALDQRLVNPALPDYEGSKVNACLENVYRIWQETNETKSTQLVFCDLSTPHGDGKFNVYDDIREKLIAKGIPPEEIAFVHNADTDVKKKELFAKVRSGQVRILLGSTAKMGAGTNVQKRLIANHDLDCPWRPSDLEQRAGRIVRQGNSNSEVDVIRYVTTGTFDAYMYQLLETKQKFISQIMTSKSPVRSAEDVDEMALSYAEIKAIASGNPKIMEKMQLDADVAKLKLQKASHLSQRYSLEDKLMRDFPKEIKATEERIAGYEADMRTVVAGTHENEKGFSPMVILGETYTEKADAGKAILEICKRITNPEPRPLGFYRGLQTEIGFDTFGKEFFIILKGSLSHRVPLGQDANGIITRLDNAIEAMETKRKNCVEQLDNLHIQVENAKAEVATPFPDEAILQEKSKRLDELNAELNMDKRENEIADDEQEQDEKSPDRGEPDCGDDRDDR